MDFIKDLNRFCANHADKQIAVLFHTSTILNSLAQLQEFFSNQRSNVYAFIPENCVYELKLLAKCSSFPKYREKASFLLEHCSTTNAWAYRDICKFKDVFLKSYQSDIAVFVFFEPAAASAFSEQLGSVPDVYILNCDPYNRKCTNCTPVFSGTRIDRVCFSLRSTELTECTKGAKQFTVRDGMGKTVATLATNELKKFHSGGEAVLYTTPALPGKVVKIFNRVPNKNMVRKFIQLLPLSAKIVGCVLPEALLYCNDVCVGYIMKKLNGSDLGSAMSDFSDAQRKQLVRDVSVILLELRLTQILVTDISSGNVYIDANDRICFVDCDSMEMYCFPGGGTTYPYGHPDVTEDYFYNKLRKPEHFNFSYAVLLFHLLLGIENPLIQKGLGDEDPQWKKHKFPYANQNGKGVCAPGTTANERKLAVWCQQSEAVREGFVGVFNFQTTYDIGEWIKMIGIC